MTTITTMPVMVMVTAPPATALLVTITVRHPRKSPTEVTATEVTATAVTATAVVAAPARS